eukprot:CAMPEP_0119042014 /NCGR_PEP_ID=MMETSP1177-20130426/14293_1 /TAXON_ID=2985 /ORGANISM="Ochromonas sp, Strain CCMP1899" /LENGTH=385 /DNA_ID=CAMNT_0007008513 /DNA_START=152 /DNA_END=1306 /DNA_ORIENTATION=+
MTIEYSPEIVAQSFIKQFYEMLAKNPSEMHRFYKEESFFTHCEGQQTTSAVQGMEAIRERVSQLSLAGARVDLTEGSVDAQRSGINGVFLVVTGDFAQPSQFLEPRKFVQTFFLASQAPTGQAASMTSYFVCNSVFRLLGPAVPLGANSTSVSIQVGEVPVVVDASTATATTATSTTATSTADSSNGHVAVKEIETVEVPVYHRVTPELVEVKEVPANVAVHFEEIVKVNVVETKQTVSVVESASPQEITAPSVPKSYSDMARAAASQQAPPSPARFAPRPVRTSSSSTPKDNTASKQVPTPSSPSHSLYVKQVPEAVTEADVLALFGKFGTVKRVELNGPRGFAFVDYDSAASVQACLASTKEGPLELLGAALKVEERTPKGNG